RLCERGRPSVETGNASDPAIARPEAWNEQLAPPAWNEQMAFEHGAFTVRVRRWRLWHAGPLHIPARRAGAEGDSAPLGSRLPCPCGWCYPSTRCARRVVKGARSCAARRARHVFIRLDGCAAPLRPTPLSIVEVLRES